MSYNNLGNLGYYDVNGNGPQLGWGLQNTDPFLNLQGLAYWSGTEYAPNQSEAWIFAFPGGAQFYGDKASNLAYAWAVRDGGALVPEPATMLLLGSGLAGLGFYRRRFGK